MNDIEIVKRSKQELFDLVFWIAFATIHLIFADHYNEPLWGIISYSLGLLIFIVALINFIKNPNISIENNCLKIYERIRFPKVIKLEDIKKAAFTSHKKTGIIFHLINGKIYNYYMPAILFKKQRAKKNNEILALLKKHGLNVEEYG